jgi:hypothetical protein
VTVTRRFINLFLPPELAAYMATVPRMERSRVVSQALEAGLDGPYKIPRQGGNAAAGSNRGRVTRTYVISQDLWARIRAQHYNVSAYAVAAIAQWASRGE